ncbi:hypothetical protein AB6A40_004508 [Gnathostoma spinigerum]|uniref:TspO/MBR-related protein n=1 Tax=Gnathostoma spinigerum TaxID=75299 RepID=A0ABD6EI18_9BILA
MVFKCFCIIMHWTSSDTKKALLASLIPTGAALTSFSCFAKDKDVMEWWTNIKKPTWAPSDPKLYAAVDLLTLSPLGVASYICYKTGGGFDYSDTKLALGLYGANLALSMATIPLVKKRNMKCIFYNTVLLHLTAIAAAYTFYKIDKTAGLLILPYSLWTGFYAFLTHSIRKANEIQDHLD